MLNIKTLLNNILHEKKGFNQKDLMVRSTVISRLEMLINLFGEVILIDSDMLQLLSEKKIILSTSGLMTESESWLTEFLLLWEYMYRVYNPPQRILSLHIYDECQHRLFSSEKEKNVHKIGASVISQLVDQARAMNIGICSLSQEPSTLIKAIINNSWLKIAFHLGSGTEIQVIKDAMGLDSDQAEILHYLETGEAIVRMAGGYMDAIPVKFDNFSDIDKLGNNEFWSFQIRQKEKLYKDSGLTSEGLSKKDVIPAKPTSENTQLPEPYTDKKPTNLIPICKKTPVVRSKILGTQTKSAAYSILRVWLHRENPF